jgi:hypothetical protein
VVVDPGIGLSDPVHDQLVPARDSGRVSVVELWYSLAGYPLLFWTCKKSAGGRLKEPNAE